MNNENTGSLLIDALQLGPLTYTHGNLNCVNMYWSCRYLIPEDQCIYSLTLMSSIAIDYPVGDQEKDPILSV